MVDFSNAKPLPSTFPFNMMEYITKNPPRKPETQLKLIKTCKFFFQQHPVIPVDHLTMAPTINDSSVSCWFGSRLCRYHDLNHMDKKLKFWVCNGFNFVNNDVENRDSFIALKSRIYRCSLTTLVLANVTLMHDEWEFLVAGEKLQHITLHACNVKRSNDEIMPLEDMLANVNGNIEFLKFQSNLSAHYTPLTFPNLGTRFTNLKYLQLININADLDPDNVGQFIKENPSSEYYFEFDAAYPEDRKKLFEDRLTTLTDEIRSRVRVK